MPRSWRGVALGGPFGGVTAGISDHPQIFTVMLFAADGLADAAR